MTIIFILSALLNAIGIIMTGVCIEGNMKAQKWVRGIGWGMVMIFGTFFCVNCWLWKDWH